MSKNTAPIKKNAKLLLGALASLAVLAGVQVSEVEVDAAVEAVGQVAAGGLALYALGRVVWDRIRGLA